MNATGPYKDGIKQLNRTKQMRDFTYFVDLNPLYPSRGQHRWAVLYKGATTRVFASYTRRPFAESCAKAWNEAERDPFADTLRSELEG